ncbi:MAG: pyroglutamyl-peptidase I [Rhodoferax sp.]|nr:pyroglutamyl-peptidase I [Rhodoferax sp.]
MLTRKAPALPAPAKVLLTGFDAFGGESLNPSWLAVKALHGRKIAGHTVVAAQLPTVFDDSLRELDALLQKHQPALVICVGQAGGRNALSLERVAINVNDARITDNAANQPIDTPVISGGPAAYFTTLPIKAMLAALRQEEIAVEVSQTAGTFVCNHVFYGLMHALATKRKLRHTRGGFVHVPFLPEQGKPNMALEDMVRGLRLAVRCALQTREDQLLGAGTTH